MYDTQGTGMPLQKRALASLEVVVNASHFAPDSTTQGSIMRPDDAGAGGGAASLLATARGHGDVLHGIPRVENLYESHTCRL